MAFTCSMGQTPPKSSLPWFRVLPKPRCASTRRGRPGKRWLTNLHRITSDAAHRLLRAAKGDAARSARRDADEEACRRCTPRSQPFSASMRGIRVAVHGTEYPRGLVWLSPPCRWRRDWGADAPHVQFITHVDANPVPGRMSPRPRIRHRDPRNQTPVKERHGARHRLIVDVRSHDNRIRGRSRFHRGGRHANSWRDERGDGIFAAAFRPGRIGVAFLVIGEVDAREGPVGALRLLVGNSPTASRYGPIAIRERAHAGQSCLCIVFLTAAAPNGRY